MWELDCEESWAPKNLCFWTVVLEKTLESPLDWKEIQSVHSKGNQSWVFFGRNDAKAEIPVVWPPLAKSWLIGKDSDAGRDWGQEERRDWEQEEKGTTEDEMARWHHWLDGHEFGWTLGVGDGQGGLECCYSQGHKESDMTEQLNWTEGTIDIQCMHAHIYTHHMKVCTDANTNFWNNDSFLLILFWENIRQVLVLPLQWKWKSLSRVQLFAPPWTKQSMEFSRPVYWSG